jgi:aminopeptidase-like protein
MKTDQTMAISDLKKTIDLDSTAQEMNELMHKLYPICRSITGNGLRDTLRIIQEYIPLTMHEIPTGTKVFDWTVPKEWNIKDAYIKNSNGDRIIDFRESNLHVMGYSVPVHDRMSLSEMKKHLHSLPDHPDWIPYRTSYYKENWGFCLSHNLLLKLEEDTYEVCIDSSLGDGHLTYGEYFIKGETSEEILLSCHACHPSLCNDNVAGIALTSLLGKYLSFLSLRYSYRILFIPGTIGSITWLSLNEAGVSNIKHGLIVTCVGDPGMSTYKRSRIGNAEIDIAVEHVLKHSGNLYKVVDFSPYGYDERQYCSPGFNLSVGCLQRTPHGEYPEYHTSADNCDFVRPEYLADSFSKYLSVINILENNRSYLNTNPKCEPQLGKRGLYTTTGGQNHAVVDQMALLWVLNLSDGRHSLLDIAEKSGMKFDLIYKAQGALLKIGLLINAKENSR